MWQLQLQCILRLLGKNGSICFEPQILKVKQKPKLRGDKNQTEPIILFPRGTLLIFSFLLDTKKSLPKITSFFSEGPRKIPMAPGLENSKTATDYYENIIQNIGKIVIWNLQHNAFKNLTIRWYIMMQLLIVKLLQATHFIEICNAIYFLVYDTITT